MDTCTFETGLLKKKPCGQTAATRCANCEQALCAKHAIPEPTDTGRKTGKFMCKDCAAAQTEYLKTNPTAAAPAKATAAKPAAAPAAKPAAKEAPKEAPKDEQKPDHDAPLDFNPAKK